MDDLARVQAWFLTVLATPNELEDGLANAHARLGLDLDDVVRGRPGAPRHTRMAVYANSYLLRLVQCLEAEFPVLRAVLGEALFNLFAATYVWERPSRAPSLYALGEQFADFLEHTQRGAQELGLPVDLARLERARAEVGRSRGVETLEARGPSGRWRAAPNLQLLTLRHPIIELVRRVDAGGEPDAFPAPRRSHIAVSRVGYHVRLEELTPWKHRALTALQKTDLAVAELTEHAPVGADGWSAGVVGVWLEEAVAAGQIVEAPETI